VEKRKVLIVGDRDDFYQQIVQLVGQNGFIPLRALAAGAIDAQLEKHNPSFAIAVVSRPSIRECLRPLKAFRAGGRTLPVILATHHSSEKLAIEALRAGARDYVCAPISNRSLMASIQRILQNQFDTIPRENTSPAATTADQDLMVGRSRAMAAIKAYIAKVARTDSTVLITGETGTGKELATELIHAQSARYKKPLVRVNCAAIPDGLVESELFGYRRGAFSGAMMAQEGKFALAHSGTLFLDEIGEMSLYTQAKILRSIESQEIFPLGARVARPLDVRVIAATNRDPEKLVAQRAFRRDLLYRLDCVRIHLPPLRERKEDIPDLAAWRLDVLNERMQRDIQSVADDALAALMQYQWPGNVRELNNLLEAAFINCESKHIHRIDFPKVFIKKLRYGPDSPATERDRLLAALAATHWNKSAAARKLRWSRMRVYRSLRRYNIVQPISSPPNK
jgi:DNA-binding NtrC family response regulator